MSECDAWLPASVGQAFFIVCIVLVALLALLVANARLYCCSNPLLSSFLVSDSAFLQEYDRRLDVVAHHDVKKRYKIGKTLGSGVTSEVFAVIDKFSGRHAAAAVLGMCPRKLVCRKLVCEPLCKARVRSSKRPRTS